MEKKHRFIIYDRKEMLVLILLAVMVAVFAFTLGVHLGKRVGVKGVTATPETVPAPTLHDKVPGRQDLTQQGEGVPQAVDENLNRSLHEEVARTGIKLDTPRPVELPDEPRSKNAGATNTTPQAAPSPVVPPAKHEAAVKHAAPKEAEPTGPQSEQEVPATHRPPQGGRYTLQVGSFPSLAEAAELAESLEALGMKPVLRSAVVKDKGRWYRIYLGGYQSKDEAEAAGERYKTKRAIDSFIVANQIE